MLLSKGEIMKKLLLISSLGDAKEQLNHFVKKANIKSKNVLFIPTAGLMDNTDDYPEYIQEEMSVLDESGYRLDILNIATTSKVLSAQKIMNAKMICISGGSTFFLLQELKKKELLTILRKKIIAGCPYIGESAGAIILSRDIEYAQYLDDKEDAPELTDYKALNVINFYPLPHYIEEPFVESAQKTFKIYNDKLKLIPINNHQGITVFDDNITII